MARVTPTVTVWVMPAKRDVPAIVLLVLWSLTCLSPTPAGEPPGTLSLWAQKSARGMLDVTVAPQSGAARIGALHSWVVALRDAQGNPVYPARISIDGGMPAHGHGLPTRPQVTRYLGNGEYLIEGVRFNMAGDWVWRLRIETPAGVDEVKFDLLIDY